MRKLRQHSLKIICESPVLKIMFLLQSFTYLQSDLKSRCFLITSTIITKTPSKNKISTRKIPFPDYKPFMHLELENTLFYRSHLIARTALWDLIETQPSEMYTRVFTNC